MKKTFPVHSYPWHIQDWTNSKIRLTASLPARAIYRDLIDFCTAEGYVPRDPYFMARVAACTPEDIEKYWPEIEHKFRPDPSDDAKLINKKALSIRNTIQSRKRKQSKANTGKRKEDKRVTERVNLKSTVSQPRVIPPPPSPSPSPSLTQSTTNPPNPPDGGQFSLSSQSEISSSENGKKRFDAGEFFEAEFWPQVWLKKGKGGALRSFKRVARSKTAADKIRDAAIQQGPILMDQASKSDREPIMPQTWLNQGRFDDEIQPVAKEENEW
jgi:hypothetical protein